MKNARKSKTQNILRRNNRDVLNYRCIIVMYDLLCIGTLTRPSSRAIIKRVDQEQIAAAAAAPMDDA